MIKPFIKSSQVLVVLALAWVLSGCALLPAAAPPLSAEIVALQDNTGAEGYARVYGPRAFAFPQDHGPHDEYQTEWWYYTGNVQTADGRHFGYQLTFFRRALTPAPALGRTSDWATDQVYFAHFALTDAAGERHTASERFSRGAAGLAGAQGDPYRVWLEDWEAVALERDADRVRLRAVDGDRALDLTLESEKPLVLQGDAGYSPKSDAPGNASYYVSFTRMATRGTLTVDGVDYAVSGLSWMDHEWSTSVLGAEIAGWDWFSIQLDDRREIMYFQLRRTDGTSDPASSGTLVEADGTTRHLTRDEVTLAVQGEWRSPDSGAAYPAGWRLAVPSAGIDLTLTPHTANQELRVSFTYWEGAVRVTGSAAGNGYVELTGYAAGR